jgi:hypothetical protein
MFVDDGLGWCGCLDAWMSATEIDKPIRATITT